MKKINLTTLFFTRILNSMLINKICNAFKSAKIQYALVGGHAVALHGAVRGTVDLDFIIRWDNKTSNKVEKTLKNIGFISCIPTNGNEIFSYRDEYIKKPDRMEFL